MPYSDTPVGDNGDTGYSYDNVNVYGGFTDNASSNPGSYDVATNAGRSDSTSRSYDVATETGHSSNTADYPDATSWLSLTGFEGSPESNKGSFAPYTAFSRYDILPNIFNLFKGTKQAAPAKQSDTKDFSFTSTAWGKTSYDPVMQQIYQPYIDMAADEYGVSRALVTSVIGSESNFNPFALGSDGKDIGLGQIRPSTAKMLGVNPYDPMENIFGVAHYLSILLKQSGGNEKIAVQNYNGSDHKVAYANAVLARAYGKPSRYNGHINNDDLHKVNQSVATDMPVEPAGKTVHLGPFSIAIPSFVPTKKEITQTVTKAKQGFSLAEFFSGGGSAVDATFPGSGHSSNDHTLSPTLITDKLLPGVPDYLQPRNIGKHILRNPFGAGLPNAAPDVIAKASGQDQSLSSQFSTFLDNLLPGWPNFGLDTVMLNVVAVIIALLLVYVSIRSLMS